MCGLLHARNKFSTLLACLLLVRTDSLLLSSEECDTSHPCHRNIALNPIFDTRSPRFGAVCRHGEGLRSQAHRHGRTGQICLPGGPGVA